MRGRHEAEVAARGFEGDHQLQQASDDRRCLALYSLCDSRSFKPSSQLGAILARLREALGGRHVVYGAEEPGAPSALFGRLHFTYLQLVGFDMYGKVPIPGDYNDLVEAALLRHLHAFKLNFSRLILTRKSLLLVGHPTVDLNWSREQLRRVLARTGYPLYEPYKNDIAHLTLVRFAADVTPQETACLAQAVAEAERAESLGTAAVNELALSAASWRMQRAELPCGAGRIALQQ
jgi:hypothetical protein